MNIQVNRSGQPTVQLPLNVSNFSDTLMGDHELVFDFTRPMLLDIQVGDSLVYKGQLMIVNKTPVYTNDGTHVYAITFQGVRHSLERWLIKDEGTPFFEYFGDLSDYMAMFLECVNAIEPGWTLGEIDEVEPLPLTFDMNDCFSALTMIAELFECEWIIRGKQISVKKSVGVVRDLSFSYGKGNGLYSLTREPIDDKKIVTRAYAVGGSQNLPAGYMPKRLTLPGYLEDPTAVELYGVREGAYTDEDIYPSRTGSVTAIGQINEGTWIVNDSSIDFDLEGLRISGTDAKIVFKSGALNGQEFKILSYNHERKEIRYEANKDSNGALSPTGLYRAEVGDQYTLIGIRMPQSYVDAALAKLAEKRAEYLESNKVPRVVYALDVDVLNLKRLNTEIHAGDIVNIRDAGIGLDANIRVTAVSYPGHFPDVLESGMKFTADISSEVTYNRIQIVEKDIKKTKEAVTQISRESWENDRRNIIALNEFIGKVFDPDGNLENPLIQAIAGLFGTDSQYYDLIGVQLVLNAGNNPNAISMTAGQLVHKRYKIDGLGYIWQLDAFAQSGLDPIKPYYLAAKCSRTALIGEWMLSDTPIETDAEVGYWYFNLGVLSSVIEGERSFRPTKLFTLISGGNIETDTITAYLINVARLFAQVVTVGSDGFVNAGISGLADQGNLSQRFWAGASEANRYAAPFQVLNDGSLQSTRGKIGGFNIGNNSLRIGTDDTWEVNGQSVFLTPEYFMLRDNGTIRGQRREMSWNLYRDILGVRRAVTQSLFNTIATADPQYPYTNVALELEAANGNTNYALYVNSGLSRFKGITHAFQDITGANQTIDEEFSLAFVRPEVVPVNLYLPTYPELGYEVTIKNLSPNDFVLRSNNGSIIQENGSATTANTFRRYAIKTFLFNGEYWIEMFQVSNN